MTLYRFSLHILFAFVALAVLSACAENAEKPVSNRAKSPPMAYVDWCTQDVRNCPAVDQVFLETTPKLMGQLEELRQAMNLDVRWEPDQPGRDVWQYPFQGVGDCEDKAIYGLSLAEQRFGLPRGAFRFVSGKDPWGRPHAYLAVYTTDGVWALDEVEVAPLTRFRATAEWIETYYCARDNCRWAVLPRHTARVAGLRDRN